MFHFIRKFFLFLISLKKVNQVPKLGSICSKLVNAGVVNCCVGNCEICRGMKMWVHDGINVRTTDLSTTTNYSTSMEHCSWTPPRTQPGGLATGVAGAGCILSVSGGSGEGAGNQRNERKLEEMRGNERK